VQDAPIAGFSVDDATLDIYDTEVQFFNSTVNGTSYVWDFGDNSANVTSENTSHSFPPEIGGYVVTLYAVNDAGCMDSVSMVITLDDVLIFYMPNSFTPDGDDYNEVFQPVFTSGYDPFDFDLFIFNRWGEVIWESHDVTVGWDGTYGMNGRGVQDGTYTWKMEFKETMTDKRHTYTGHVTKIR
jgi:gliding motility-associated-like protein